MPGFVNGREDYACCYLDLEMYLHRRFGVFQVA